MNLKLTLTLALFTIISANTIAQNKKAGPKKPMPKQASNGNMKVTTPVITIGGGGPVKLITNNDSLSYGIGMNIGQNLKAQGLEGINLEIMKSAMNEVLKGGNTLISQEACMPLIMASMKKVQEKKYSGVKTEGEKFLADNAKVAGVITLPSGLQYSIMKKGEGVIPKATDKVNVHYHGTTIDGKIFDSSVDRGTPASFGVTQVIAGWVEALQLMPVGSKWKLFIPQALAYGERGAGENIPPFSTLVFEVELLGIEKAEEPK